MERQRIWGATLLQLVDHARQRGVDPDKTWGLWSIHGEDPNCDMGGAHDNPFIETFEGTFREAATRATTELSKSYFGWGGGGFIEGPGTITRLLARTTTNDPLRALAERLNAAQKEYEQAQKDHAAAIRTVECRLSCMKKLEPILKQLNNDEMNVAVEIFTGLVKNHTA